MGAPSKRRAVPPPPPPVLRDLLTAPKAPAANEAPADVRGAYPGWAQEPAELSVLLCGAAHGSLHEMRELLDGCQHPRIAVGSTEAPEAIVETLAEFDLLVVWAGPSVASVVRAGLECGVPCLVVAPSPARKLRVATRRRHRDCGAAECLFDDELSVALLETAIRGVIMGWVHSGSGCADTRRRTENVDPLTGLPSLAAFHAVLGDAVTRRKYSPRDAGFAVLFADVERFGKLRDTIGNAAGDQMLVELADRLVGRLMPGEIAARVGAHQFAVLISGTEAQPRAKQLSQQLHAVTKRPVDIDGEKIQASLRIGSTASTRDYGASEEVIRDARAAMLRARDEGRDQAFQTSFHSDAVDRFRLESALHRALENDEFRLHYQPIVSLASRRVLGFEALIRWSHPRDGIVPPFKFIPVAEETGLIVPIGTWVMQEAARQMRAWDVALELEADMIVSINVSGQQVSEPDFVAQIENALSTSGLPARCLKVEFTESSLMVNTDRVVAVVQQLRVLGVQVWIDDFGTGYSSLSYLQRFPVNGLKIDKSFVDPLDGTDESAAMVRTIVELADNLGLHTVAEGIEHEVQAEHLLDLGVLNAQGYLFAKPLTAGDAFSLLART